MTCRPGRNKPGAGHAIEFTAELTGAARLPVPAEVAARLPKSGKARITVLTGEPSDNAAWQAGAYEQPRRGALSMVTCAASIPSSVGAALAHF